MSNYNSLKTTIDANIKQNGNQEITGQILNSVLNQMVTTLGAGYQFAGVATINTNPGTPDAKVFYIANGKGTYEKFAGINVTEDDVVVLYWDTAWHKVSTGIASQEKLSELSGLLGEKADEADLAAVAKTGKYADLVGKPTTLSGYGITDAYTKTQTDEVLNTKQNELTLAVKDNGNIVISNIQGQSKEFMPATPSGDPMHYAYVAAGAEYNDTGADIVKTTPWADLLDDDYDGDYGKTVVHKAGYWYLSGLGDITNEEIRKMYIATSNFPPSPYLQSYFGFVDFRTNFGGLRQMTGWAILDCSTIVGGGQKFKILNFSSFRGAFLNISQLGSVMHIIGSNFFLKSANSFNNSEKLVTMSIKRLEYNVNAGKLPVLSVKSVLFMIQNEAAKSPITITLHADVYNRCMANADVLAALEAHTNISLASA